MFKGMPTINFQALHYTADDIAGASYDFKLVARPETIVHIDYKQNGIGSNSCGPILSEPYRFNDKNFAYSFTFKPIFIETINPIREARILPEI